MAVSWLHNWLDTLMQFMEQGGQILWWLAAVVIVCWLFVVERVIYLFLLSKATSIMDLAMAST